MGTDLIGDPYRLQFDGSNDNAQYKDLAKPQTLLVWFQVDTVAGGTDYIFRHDNGGTYAINQDGNLLLSYNGANQDTAALETGHWYHLAITNDGSSTTYYLDGVVIGGGSGGADTGTTDLQLGYTSEYAQYLDGGIANFRAYSDALTEAEILAIYEDERTRFAADPGVVTIDRVTPSVGPDTGGTTVTIYGWNFSDENVTSVTFGGAPGADLNVISDSKLTVVTPANSAGFVDVAVVGDSTDTQTAAFLYTQTATDNLLAWFDAANIDGLGNRGDGSTNTTWKNLIDEQEAGVYNVTHPTSGASGWDGAGTVADPDRLQFDGTNDLVQYRNLSSPQTFLVWFQVDTVAGGNDYIFRHDNGGSYLINQNGTLLARYNAGATQYTAIETGTWYHGVITNDGATTTFYLNGQEFATTSTAADTGTTDLEIGYTSQYAEYLDGAIADFRVYSDGMTQEEVLAIYEEERTRFETDPGVVRIDSISPGIGPTAGGTTVTITGWNFSDENVTSVTFGGTPGTGLNVISDSKLTVVTPANSAGFVDVSVVGDSSDTQTTAFMYTDTVTDNLLAWFDAANVDGMGTHGDGSTNTTWKNLAQAQDAGVYNFAQPASGTSGWDGVGTMSDPDRLQFDGANDLVQYRSLSSPQTFLVWFQVDTLTGGNDYIFRHDNGGSYLINQNGTLLARYNTGAMQSTALETGTWCHGVITNDGATTTFYLNGQEFATTSTAADTGTTDLEIGYTSQYAEYLDGAIASFRVYSDGMTQEEVLAIYNEELSRYVPEISGTVYTDEGSTDIGADKTVRIAINGTDFGTTAETDADGAYSISGLTLSPGDVLTVYLEDETQDAVAVTVSDGGSLAGLDLYQNRLIVRHDNGGSLTNADLGSGVVTSEDDISNVYSVSAGSLILADAKSLYIPTSHAFAPGDDVSLGGSFNAQGTFIAGTYTVTFTGSGAETVTSNGSSFNNLTLNNASGLLTPTDVLDVDGVLNIAAGTFRQTTSNVAAGAITIASGAVYSNQSTGNLTLGLGGVTNNGTINLNANGGGPGADDILIRSDVNGVQRAWDGTGKFLIRDVDVKDMAGTAQITAYSSTDSGNNGVNWTFNSNFLYVYDGGGTGDNASTADNWDVDSAPTANAIILLDDTSTNDLTWDLDIALDSWTQTTAYTGTVTVSTVYDAGGFDELAITNDLTINGGTWTHLDNSTAETNRLKLSVGGDFTLGAGGSIDVVGLGYDGLNGPGSPGSNHYWDGGAHGGRGGEALSDAASEGTTYGSFTAPTTLGSGAESYAGGGAVQIAVTGATILDGMITATGTSTSINRGAGAGGSVYLTTATLSGSGVIDADGGDASLTGFAGGGGGRAAVILTQAGADFSGFSGSVTAFGGDASSALHDGAAGTVYRQLGDEAAGEGTLIIDNNDRSTRLGTTTQVPDGATWTVHNLMLENGGILEVGSGETLLLQNNPTSDADANDDGIRLDGGSLTFNASLTVDDWSLIVDGALTLIGDVTIADGGNLTHSGNSTAATYRTDLTITGNLDLNAGGTINVTGLGYDANSGPGFPGSNHYWDGASHGGMGGESLMDATNAGVTYGSITAPTTLGSGSEGSFAGGGAVQLTVSGGFTLNGTIEADGQSSTINRGGAAGGSVFVTTATISGTGNIHADGGDASNSGFFAGGGGGRVSVVLTQGGADFSGFSGSMTADGGDASSADNDGAAGTVYKQTGDQGAGDGELIIDNNSLHTRTGVTTSLDGQDANSTTIGSLVLQNGAEFTIGSDDTLTIGGTGSTLTVNTGTTLINEGLLNLGGTAFTSEGTVSFDAAGNTVKYTGQTDDSAVTTIATTYSDLAFDNAGTVFTLGGSTTTNADVSITAGTLDVSLSDHSLDVAGDWVNNDTFDARTAP